MSREKERVQAEAWVGPGGSEMVKKQIIQDLMVNYQIEIQEGRDVGDDDKGRAVARQCRKQAKETAELIMKLTGQMAGSEG